MLAYDATPACTGFPKTGHYAHTWVLGFKRQKPEFWIWVYAVIVKRRKVSEFISWVGTHRMHA